jgi:HD-like signal output (HDOD) protein/CheY-like chemotaxis protein
MKKRVLFVDDEAMVLQGLQRMLRPMRNDWDMEFVESGAVALERLAAAPADVVVSDMRMPGMNGAQLLTEVMRRFPKTVRIILSGHADHDLVLKAVGSTHQYLNKPCEPEVLKATVQRAVALGDSLENEQVKSLVAQMSRLPSLPNVYLRVVDELQSNDVSLARIGDIMAKDVGMSAQVLKLVNSAFFGLRRRVANPTDAVTYLGIDTIKALVLSLHTFSQFDNTDLGGISMVALRNHSLLTAGCARHIAKLEAADPKLVDEAFIGGLLHDTGRLVLAANFSAQYSRVMRLAHDGGLTVTAAEHGVFGCTHADVGGYLLGLWGLPVPVVECVSYHHHPNRTLENAFSPLTAVHAANVLAYELDKESTAGRRPEFDHDYLTRVGKSARASAWQEDCRINVQPGGGL